MDRAAQDQILILLAPGFEESDAIAVTRRLRQAGLPVALVGISANPLRGAYGLSLAPDRTLSHVDAGTARVVVLPRGRGAARQLAGDPRVQTLLRRVLVQGGYIVALGAAYPILSAAGTFGPAEGLTVDALSILWDGESLSGDRTPVGGWVVLGTASERARESALSLVSLLQGAHQ